MPTQRHVQTCFLCGASAVRRHKATILDDGQPLLCVPATDLNVSVAALASAPTNWGFLKERDLRRELWAALQNDDATKMESSLRRACGKGWEIGSLLVRLRLALWSNSGGKHGKQRGLLYVAACNASGVPQDGAVRCIERLLEMAPPGDGELWQLRVALRTCVREKARALLEPHLKRLEGTVRAR